MYFSDEHKGENIAAALREGLSSRDLNEENPVMTDSTLNMVEAAELPLVSYGQ